MGQNASSWPTSRITLWPRCYGRMATLFRQVITAGHHGGTPPSLVRLPVTPEEVAASYAGAGEELGEDDDHDLDRDVRDPGPACEP